MHRKLVLRHAMNRPERTKQASARTELIFLHAVTFLRAAELDDHCSSLPAGTILIQNDILFYSVLILFHLIPSHPIPSLLAHDNCPTLVP